ncbi:glycoside hydrolase family 44-domain-containing protein [Coprinopsis sp. MPI-PUGE-AT-0042]|nr:glycoside hydrolase family 44-domain-containing protein [Coprinopsis sp. MPI-PUGE-AT-0042]
MARVSTLSRAAFGSVLILVRLVNALDDRIIYQNDALTSGWENWSWSSEINFAATDMYAGTSGTSMSVKSTEWAALSLKHNDPFNTYAGLRFDIEGNQPGLQISFSATADDSSTPGIALSDISKSVTTGKFTTITIDFKALPVSGAPLPSGSWNRIGFQATASGATYHIDNIVLLGAINITPEILSAEPLGSNVVAVTTKGSVDLTTLKVLLNGKAITVSSRTSYSPPDTPSKSITYLNLATPLASGKLDIVAGSKNYTYTLPPASTGTLNSKRSPINPLIYGVNWPKDANYIKTLGVTVSRWGGNAVTAYNPFGHFTNAGADWFFQNRGSDNSDDWIGWVQGAGSDAIMTVPGLDWVSKDTSSYSYPKTQYPQQERFDTYKPDSGNGRFPNGTTITPPPDPKIAYTNWNTTMAKTWLQSLKNKPKFATMDNEIEITHSTHSDMHPAPMSFDEEFDRVSRFAIATKEALPDVQILAPSTCAWWFYWTSAVGYSDNAAHGNLDFLPWFLQKMKELGTQRNKRFLDFLDIHYYYAPDTGKEDDAALALRLRMSRSLWDETYVDESWIGTNNPENHQPNARIVSLIPRFKKLIQQHYPGTKLAVSEWSGANENHVTGGLLTADSLGIFGKYGLDAATYWTTPNELSPGGLAYWLYRGSGTFFGSTSVGIDSNQFSPDLLGIYASLDSRGKNSVVILNKNPRNATAISLSGLPAGDYFFRHFGGTSGIAKWQSTSKLQTNYIVVPSYTAIFLQQK